MEIPTGRRPAGSGTHEAAERRGVAGRSIQGGRMRASRWARNRPRQATVAGLAVSALLVFSIAALAGPVGTLSGFEDDDGNLVDNTTARNRLEQLRAHDLDRHGAEPGIQQDGARLDLPRARGRAEDEQRHRVRRRYQAGRQLRFRDRRIGAEQGRPQARLHGDRDRQRARVPQPRLGPDPAEHDLVVGARRVRVQQGHLRQLRRSRRTREPHRRRHADRLRLRRRQRRPPCSRSGAGSPPARARSAARTRPAGAWRPT